MTLKTTGAGERGASLLEFTIAALVLMTAVFGVIEMGRLLWTHNALTDATRRGARFAVTHGGGAAQVSAAQRVAVYGTSGDGTRALVDGLKPSNVKVTFSDDYNVGQGTASVSIENYEFNFVVPIFGRKVRMPAYHTTLTGENAGQVPQNIP